MKVFISWSGERSKALANALREWLQPILQSVDVWMSDADIEAGDRWGQEVAKELAECNFGILCVTPENLGAAWLLFEAGALAKSLEGGRVIPLLFEVELRDISGPLAQFQAKKFDRNGLSEVIHSINRSLPTPIGDQIINSLLVAMWPVLQGKIDTVPKKTGDIKRVRNQSEILEELVASVRSFDSRLRETEIAISEGSFKSRRRKPKLFPPMIYELLSSMEDDEPMGLLIVSGLIRDDLPWLSELLNEAYREARRGSFASIRRLSRRMHVTMRALNRIPFSDELLGSREQNELLMEIPHMVSRYLENLAERREMNSERRKTQASTDNN